MRSYKPLFTGNYNEKCIVLLIGKVVDNQAAYSREERIQLSNRWVFLSFNKSSYNSLANSFEI